MIIGACVLVATCTAIWWFFQRADAPAAPVPAVLALKECLAQRDFIACARPLISQELDRRDTASLIADIVSLGLPQNQCHYALHVVGADLLHRYETFEDAIRTCTHDCNSACQHGLIGEAFTDALGFDTGDIDAAHLTGEELRAMGHDLCAGEPNGSLLSEAVRGTCHGLGHALYLAYQEFGPAIRACEESAAGPQLDACMRGVYMEYTDVLSSRSAWRDMYDLPPYPRIDELGGLCESSDARKAAACFYYFPIAVRQTYRFHGTDLTREQAAEKTAVLCASRLDPHHRKLCFIGYGVTLYGTLLADEDEATRICSAFSGDDGAACMAGMVSLVVEYGDEERALSYCSRLREGARAQCYRIVFERISTLADRSIAETVALCPQRDALCEESARAAEAGEIREYFAL